MAWNEPGNNGQRDPWNKNKRNASGKSGIEATLKNALKRISKLGGPGGILTIVAAILIAWLLITSYAVIGAGQVGVVQRFGAYARTIGPGFHFKLPLPVETVQPVATSRVRAMSDQIRMLTRDEDIVSGVDFNVQYQVTDPQKYLFSARDPDGTLNEAAQAAVSAVIGAQPMDDILTGQGDVAASAPALAALQQQVRDQLQHTLDGYDCGLRVTDVSFQSITPPQEVKDAFDDVNAARQDRQGMIDQAHASTSQQIPLANGDAKHLAADADAYKAERIARAQGDAERFNLILKEYKAAPDVTGRRLWLETMEEILRVSNKVIDGSDGRSVINITNERADAQPVTNLPGVGTVAPSGNVLGEDADKGKAAMKTTAAIIIALVLLLGLNSLYSVGEGQSALVLQFGKILRTDKEPGLHAKVPLLQQTLTLDDRILSFDGQPERYTTNDKQSVNVDFYVKWRIASPADYYRATGGDELQAGQRLSPIVSNALRGIVNTRSLQQLIAGGQNDLTAGTLQQSNDQAQKTLGISVVDVRITGIEFPDDIKAAVYKRMQTERQQQAATIRADGKQEAEAIKATADSQAQIIRANAESDADKVKGEGDAQAAQIYAQAYAQDPDFFAFYRSQDAYKKAFGDGRGTIILKPDSEFLRYFGNPAPAPARH